MKTTKNQKNKTQCKNIKKIIIKKVVSVILFVLVFLMALFNSNADLMALQGTVDNPIAKDIRITIYDNSIGGTLIYDSGSDFDNAINNGRYDILLGSNTPLNLQYGRLYYLDISINGEDLDFNGSERQVFQSSVGKITGTYINNSAISSVHILDSSISGIDIADNSIEKTKIQTTGQWQESELPSLTGTWTGTLNASKIISTNLLNVNSSNTANNAITANSANALQGFTATIFFANDTMLFEKIENTNTTTKINVNGNTQYTDFFQVLLSDSADNIIYTALIDANKIGFDNNNYDFQMLVGDNGQDQIETTTYYFFMELV